MAQRPDLPRIPRRDPPTVFNQDVADGWLNGWLAGLIPSTILLFARRPRAALAVEIASEAIGAILGGLHGRKIQTEELRTGHTVSDPAYLNRGTVTGFMVGSVVNGLLSLLQVPVPLVAGLAMTATSMGVASIIRHQRLSHEFNEAMLRQMTHTPMVTPALEEPTPTLPALQPLQARQQQPVSHAARIDQKMATASESATRGV